MKKSMPPKRKNKMQNQENLDAKISENYSTFYQKFFDKFSEIKTLEVKEWKLVHMLGYLCKRYEEYYGMKYSFSFSSTSPTKSYEMVKMNRIVQMLSSDPIILKGYIDWVYDKKVIQRKKKITSLGYFANLGMINEYKFEVLSKDASMVIDRTTALSNRYLSIVAKYNKDISTYGDVAFLKMADKDGKYAIMFNELVSDGFQLSVLESIK